MDGVKGKATMKPERSKAQKVGSLKGEESEGPAGVYHISCDRGMEVAEGQCSSD